MGKHSQLGPIDPQLGMGQGPVPASALVRQFKRISDECATDPTRLSGWLPTLQQYWPGLLEICEEADMLSRTLVQEWLSKYMFRGYRPDRREQLSKNIAENFASHDWPLSHGRPIDRETARKLGLKIGRLEDDPNLQDAVLSVHHAFLITLSSTNAIKIIENHMGAKMVISTQQVMMPPFLPQPMQLPVPAAQPPPGP
jgi:hypothetical protein